MIDSNYIRDRITQLRLRLGVSEYKMSYDLGHSRSYVHNITSKKCLPTMSEFLAICEYLGVTPSQFFDDGTIEPTLVTEAAEALRGLGEEDLRHIIAIASRLPHKTFPHYSHD
ncbi:MAG: helix-turn-helix transcriptional regulator [Ruminococcaceae bacterium]|nr:helix-turn-helix transcriptional regulator [Oscillospiraceae bacterium]